ncbi:hypothetical protein [Roseibium album]|uniref:Uncharacterized protein n=1 Tax=Roseibium album TaxID=311410 RepID=A0A0M6ZNI5_9HYPH|nr:hypothetical protein [Roseibium album]CTQ63502.1 hypothetical protein LA5094_06301 [Roseibium album]CTQ63680.1 hypothetical protein LA5095_00010 [Roseibium album]CTQ72203.1 hypothetical protein LA5096_03151 [Roseibium album]
MTEQNCSDFPTQMERLLHELYSSYLPGIDQSCAREDAQKSMSFGAITDAGDPDAKYYIESAKQINAAVKALSKVENHLSKLDKNVLLTLANHSITLQNIYENSEEPITHKELFLILAEELKTGLNAIEETKNLYWPGKRKPRNAMAYKVALVIGAWCYERTGAIPGTGHGNETNKPTPFNRAVKQVFKLMGFHIDSRLPCAKAVEELKQKHSRQS